MNVYLKSVAKECSDDIQEFIDMFLEQWELTTEEVLEVVKIHIEVGEQ